MQSKDNLIKLPDITACKVSKFLRTRIIRVGTHKTASLQISRLLKRRHYCKF